ncbi:unnamed protein product [Linum tenue]|uniref:Uncharacterized protein n=1 Tax=Linum tenue TaxID=586396 RepID=A0AAV0PW70_9ROSI|nr:unnamed protein product [Linum tenue]
MARQWNSHPLLVTFCLLALWFGKKQWVIGEPVAPCFFIFGDSLVDGGNNNFLNTAAKVDYLPYGVDFPGGPTGRFSNGKTVADVITERLGLPNYIPAFASAIPATGLLQGTLYNLGARKIALAGISKIGCTPFAKTIAGRKGCVDSQNEAVVPFNKLLRDLAGRLNQDFPDAKFVYLDTMAATDPLPNTQEPCCQVQTVGLCIPNGTFCDQRDTYVYWDAFHPTQAANYIVGPFLYQTLKQIL